MLSDIIMFWFIFKSLGFSRYCLYTIKAESVNHESRKCQKIKNFIWSISSHIYFFTCDVTIICVDYFKYSMKIEIRYLSLTMNKKHGLFKSLVILFWLFMISSPAISRLLQSINNVSLAQSHFHFKFTFVSLFLCQDLWQSKHSFFTWISDRTEMSQKIIVASELKEMWKFVSVALFHRWNNWHLSRIHWGIFQLSIELQ